jgi:hypothetical protein
MTMLRPFLFPLALAAALAGCAPAFPSGTSGRPPSEAERRIAATENELGQAESEFSRLSAAAVVDCPRACSLTATICDLARRICALAGQEADLRPRCQDATQRCQRAEQATASKCTCEQR